MGAVSSFGTARTGEPITPPAPPPAATGVHPPELNALKLTALRPQLSHLPGCLMQSRARRLWPGFVRAALAPHARGGRCVASSSSGYVHGRRAAPDLTAQHFASGEVFYATCHPGLEGVVAEELVSPEVGATSVAPGRAGVHFRHGSLCMHRQCLCFACTSLPIAAFTWHRPLLLPGRHSACIWALPPLTHTSLSSRAEARWRRGTGPTCGCARRYGRCAYYLMACMHTLLGTAVKRAPPAFTPTSSVRSSEAMQHGFSPKGLCPGQCATRGWRFRPMQMWQRLAVQAGRQPELAANLLVRHKAGGG